MTTRKDSVFFSTHSHSTAGVLGVSRTEEIAKAVCDEYAKFGVINTVVICGRLNRTAKVRFKIAEVEDFLVGDGFVKRSQFVWGPRE